jgi:hypothetical protein
VIRVIYTPTERAVVLLTRPFVLLRFSAPEYDMRADRGLVRWWIKSGLLVARRGCDRNGYLQIEVERRPADEPGRSVAHVRVEVANFYPAIAFGISQWFYRETQSRIHVLVTHGFLRSLARLELAESRVGRFARRVRDWSPTLPGHVTASGAPAPGAPTPGAPMSSGRR